MTAMSNSHSSRRIPRAARYIIGALLILFVLMQFVRFVIPRFRLDNPPVTTTVNWDSAETQQLWNTACADCHSNETVYPWYSYIAPVGWLVARDVQKGRDHLNVSTNHCVELDEIEEVIREGEMPLPIYTITHPDAILTDAQRETLIAGLQATFGEARSDSDND